MYSIGFLAFFTDLLFIMQTYLLGQDIKKSFMHMKLSIYG